MRRIRERRRPLQSMRPSIPAPCVLAAASVVGVFAGEWLYGLIPPEHLYMLVVGGAILAAGVLAMLFLKRKNLVHWALAFVLIGALLGMIQLLTLDHARDEVSPGSEHYAFELSEDAKESTFGSQLIATISSGPQAGKRVMLFTNEKVELYSGDVLEADCVLSAPKEEYLAYYDQKNIAFSGSVSGFQASENSTLLSPLYQLRKQLLAVIGMGSDEQTLLRAILLGERTGLFDASFYHSIKVAGLAHLVAVSGAHLVIVTGFVTLLLKKLRVPRKLSVALQTLFLVSYVVLVGFPVSCIRAAIMSGVTLFALLAKRRSSSISALGITVMAMVAFDPSVVYQLSFQLSVAATLGIVVFMPLLNEWFQDLFPFVPAIRARIDLHDPRCTGVLASDQCCTVFARASAFAFGQHRCNALSFASAHDGIRCDARRAIRTWSSWIALSGYEWAHCILPGIRIDPVRIDSHLDYDELCLSARAWPRSALVGVVAKALPA